MTAKSRPHRWRWALLVVGALGLALLWKAGSQLTSPTNHHVAPYPAPARALKIASADHVTLAASYIPAAQPDAPAILLLHGNGGSRADVMPTALWLSAHGYAVLTIDFRGHGESTPTTKSFGLSEAHDAQAAFDWLKKRAHGGKVGVIGFSLGGAAALLGDNGPLTPDVMVLECVYPDIRHAIFNRVATVTGRWPAYFIEPLLSYQSWLRYGVSPSRISPVWALTRVTSPVMIVGGGADVYTPPEEIRSLFDAAHQNGEIWLLDGLSHDQVVSSQSKVFRSKLLSFLDKHLKN